jgi:hypothetical protein
MSDTEIRPSFYLLWYIEHPEKITVLMPYIDIRLVYFSESATPTFHFVLI